MGKGATSDEPLNIPVGELDKRYKHNGLSLYVPVLAGTSQINFQAHVAPLAGYENTYIESQRVRSQSSGVYRNASEQIIIAAIYVDDIILTGNDHKGISNLKAHLDVTFSIKDLGKLSFFLGIEVGYVSSGITLTQKKFTLELLKEAGITNCSSKVTPLPLNLKLSVDDGDLLCRS
ncbi:hypothetical protein AgCh_040296 [Apium graveolens]